MSSGPEKQEKRRSERVLIRVPIRIRGVGHDGREVVEPAETTVVSRSGALLRTSSLLKLDSPLAVTNDLSRATANFRVAWIAEIKHDGLWEIGIEAADAREDFWGIRFPASKERKP